MHYCNAVHHQLLPPWIHVNTTNPEYVVPKSTPIINLCACSTPLTSSPPATVMACTPSTRSMTLSSCRALDTALWPDADLELEGVDFDVAIEFEFTPFLSCCSEDCPLSFRTCKAIGLLVATDPSEVGIVIAGRTWIKDTAVAVGILMIPALALLLLLSLGFWAVCQSPSVRELEMSGATRWTVVGYLFNDRGGKLQGFALCGCDSEVAIDAVVYAGSRFRGVRGSRCAQVWSNETAHGGFCSIINYATHTDTIAVRNLFFGLCGSSDNKWS